MNFHFTEITRAWDAWKGFFLSLTDKHAPYKTCRVRSTKPPWLMLTCLN